MSFSAFMAKNVEKVEAEKELIVSERFKNKDGSIEKFKIRPLLAGENTKLRNSCMKQVQIPGKKGMYQKQFESFLYLKKLIVRSVTYPDLTNKELQDGYGVVGEEALLDTMLTAREYDVLSEAVQEINSVEPIQDKIDEAKN